MKLPFSPENVCTASGFEQACNKEIPLRQFMDESGSKPATQTEILKNELL